MNPMRKVTVPQSITAIETPRKTQANPSGVIFCRGGGDLYLLDEEWTIAGEAIWESSHGFPYHGRSFVHAWVSRPQAVPASSFPEFKIQFAVAGGAE
ncbi:hypothetical protein SAY86_026424 [Trapa natans]|uniref:Uncharacterized protein n=1 Tax=Trapa natans TaxID=22666 RepID=A0AAN7QEV4_TRANT|nr:hypothetical protein SAY86_026424 [Trapa natans]